MIQVFTFILGATILITFTQKNFVLSRKPRTESDSRENRTLPSIKYLYKSNKDPLVKNKLRTI